MSYTSLYFPLFLAVVLIAYYVASRSAKLQNLILLLSSLFFYAFGHIHYAFVWAGISIFTYGTALLIARFETRKKLVAAASITSIIAFFILIKYTGMLQDLFQFEVHPMLSDLQLLLPVGLSFYSFTSIGYLSDVYNKRIEACKDLLQFFAYSSFFPQLLSGPISFADAQLPQFKANRTFSIERLKEAMPYMAWGLFKKVVIANTLVKPIAYIFSHSENHHSGTLAIGLIIYSIQVYADFSGYSDMAYGIAKMFGINIPLNFRMPYFAENISDYWRRWHSSLSKWLGRYVYVPLGGKSNSFAIHVRNIIIVFAISGLWHGANMKFVAWGLINGLFYIIFLINERSQNVVSLFPQRLVQNKFLVPSGIILTFLSVTIARVYFRSETFSQGNEYLSHLISNTGSHFSLYGVKYLVICAAFIGYEWMQRKKNYALDFAQWPIRLGIYAAVIALIIVSLQQPQSTEHIYFKY